MLTRPPIASPEAEVARDFAQLVEPHRALVQRTALFALGDADEAATITQDCLLRAHARIHQFRGESTPQAWLLAIAHNLIRDRIRARRFQFWRRAARFALDPAELADALPSREASPESRLLARERVRQVAAACARLSPKQRTVFTLRFVEDMELAEIAASTGMAVASVKTHLYRALDAVRAELKGHS